MVNDRQIKFFFPAIISGNVPVSKADLFFHLSLLLTFASLPLSKNINTFCIILLVIAWFIRGGFRNLKSMLDYKPLLFISLYFLYVLGMLYTEDKSTGWTLLEQKLSLLGFPVIFATSPRIHARFIKALFSSFVISCFIASLICLAKAGWANYSLHGFTKFNIELFSAQNLSGALKIHATYLSIYMASSIFIVANHFFASKTSITEKILLPALMLYLLGFLMLLSARMIIISFILISAIVLVAFFLKGKISFKWLALLFVIFLGVTGLISQNSYFKKRFSQIYNFDMANLIGSNKENGITQRIFLWQNAKKIILKHPLLGVGTGDVNAAQDEEYRKLLENKNLPPGVVRAINSFSLRKLNVHNQFMQTTIAVGLTGLALFLVNIGISATLAYRKKQYLFLSFLALFFFGCFSESLLERQLGIVFFSFLNSLFIFNNFLSEE